MGSGGRSTAPKEGHVVQRPPTDKPPFTLAQIRKAIPPHCFERSVLKSFYYLLKDLFIVAALLYVAMAVIPALPAGLPRVAAWTLYGIAQGCVWAALWVMSHECGHHAFSDYQVLDDFLGLVLHSLLLVPYFSWKFSHRRHHANNASLEKDEVFNAATREELPWYAPMVHNPVGRLLFIALHLTIAWPLYIAFNAKGRNYGRWANHFDPYGPIFSERERVFVFISDIALLAVWFGLYKLASAFGFWSVVLVYGVPLMVAQSWLVLVTYLNHTHAALPRYDSSEWDWIRGALATMDRDYGFMNHVLHNATDTHVVHHFFPSMPHYHAMEATRAMRPILGEYYKRDPTPIVKAIWREAKECIFVEPMEDRKGVLWFSNKL